MWLYNEIKKWSGDKWLVVAPTYKILSRTTLPEFLQFFAGTDLEGSWKEAKREYLLPNGGIVYFCSADKPNSLEGGQFRGAWADEAGQMKRWAWVVIQARVGQKEGRVLLTTTPYGQNWLFRDFFKGARKALVVVEKNGKAVVGYENSTDPDYFVVQFSTDTNPHYPAREVERMKKVLSSKEYAMRYLGRFEALSGLVFPKLYECVVTEDPYVISTSDLRVGSLDPGWSDEFAGITAVYGKDERLHLRRQLYKSETLLRDVAAELDRETLYYMDPHARREMEELSRYGIWVQPGIADIRSGIFKVNEFVADHRIVIPEEEFEDLIDEGTTYQFKEGKDEPDDKAPNHLLDCLRYLVMGLTEASNMEIMYI